MAESLPPGVTEVKRLSADSHGGYWVLGSDGGVFAFNGAPFYGSYPALESMGYGKQDPSRKFVDITTDGHGGYTLHDAHEYKYNFTPPAVSSTTPEIPKTTEVATQADPNAPKPPPKSGEAVLTATLAKYGLGSLGAELLTYYRGEGGGSWDATVIKMRESPVYKDRFKGMEARQKANYGPIDEETYITWEGGAKALFDHYSIPPEFYDTQDELATFIGGNVSVDELKRRIEGGYADAMAAPAEMRQSLQSMYQVDDAHLAMFFLDPTKGEKLISSKWVASQIGGQAKIAHFGDLSAAEAEKLGAGGMTSQGAQQAFGTLGLETELLQGDLDTQAIDRATQLAAVGGDAASLAAIKRNADIKKAQFGGGGGYTQGGVGTANS